MSTTDSELVASPVRWSDIGDVPPKKVALIGFAPNTREDAPYDDPEWEVWGLNEAYNHNFMKTKDGGHRWDRWFQIHPEWSFARPNNPNHEQHYEWLQAQKPVEDGGFPIYMQKEYEEIPAAVSYPLIPIINRFGVRYFTSSFAYLVAMALYEGFETIGAWGFNMATDTEYLYQKGSTEFWLGIATALLGPENVMLPEGSHLLRGKLYGWEISRMINRQDLEFRLNAINNHHQQSLAELNALSGTRQSLEKMFSESKNKAEKKRLQAKAHDAFQKEVNALARANAIAGRLQEVRDLISYVDNAADRGRPGIGVLNQEDINPDHDSQGQISDDVVSNALIQMERTDVQAA